MKFPSPLIAIFALLLTCVSNSSAQTVLQNNSSVSGLRGGADESKLFRIDIPTPSGYLFVKTFGGAGNVDIYLRRGAIATRSAYDYASTGPNNNELIEASRPATGSWYITVYSATAFTEVTLQVSYGGVNENFLQPGEKVFEFPLEGWADSGATVGRDGSIYVGVNNDRSTGYLYGISDKGFLKWRSPLNGWIMNSAPVLGSNDRLYVNLTDGVNGSYGNLACILPNGQTQWTFGRTSAAHPPAIGYGDIIYIPSDHNSLYALRADKSVKWEFVVAGGLIASSPAIVGKDGTVYAGFHNPVSRAGILYAINPNGGKKWELPLPGKMSPPSIDGPGRILFGITHPVNKLWAVTAAGQKAWEFAAPGGDIFSEVHAYSPPVVALDGTIYISCNRRLYAVDSAGKKKWHDDPGNSLPSVPFYNSPAVDAQGNVYYGSFGNIGAGELICLNSSSGLNWEVSFNGQVLGYPVLAANDRLVIATRENQRLYVLKSATGPMNSSWPMARVNPLNTGSIELEPGPSVTINQAFGQSDPTTSPTINFTVVFSKPVTGFANGDVTIGGTALPTSAVISGSGAAYTVSVSGMSRSGTVTATVPAGVATDVFGTSNFASTSTDNLVNYQVPDTTRPTVVINQAATQPDPTGTGPIDFTIVFSEPVVGFTREDIFISGTSGANSVALTGNGTVFQASVTGMVQPGTVIAFVPAGSAQDAAGNLNLASTSSDNQVTYQPVVRPNIAVAAFPTVGGVVTGGGQVQLGTLHKVTATPNPGYSFEHWMENGTIVSVTPEYTFQVTGSRTLSAVFEKCNALLNSPANNASVTLPLNLNWTMLGGCRSRIYFASASNSQTIYALTNVFGEGTHSFTVSIQQWQQIVQALGVSENYLWTIGGEDVSQKIAYSSGNRFRVPAIETTPPFVTVTSHQNNQIVQTNRIQLAGTATDSNRGNSGIKNVRVNGAEAAGGSVTGGSNASWSITQALNLGANQISVVATDGVENQSAFVLNVIYQPPSPRFTSWNVLRGSLVMNLSVLPGITYNIQASNDLETWEHYYTGSSTSSTLTVSSAFSTATYKYFRALVVIPQ